MNRGLFIGRLGHTPELRDAGGTPVVNVNICVNVWSKNGDVPMWVPCVFWGKCAEILAQYRGKGDEVAVDGEWEPHEWTAKDGTERKELRLVIRHPGGLTLTAGRSRANEGGEPAGGESPSTGTTEAASADEDIPF